MYISTRSKAAPVKAERAILAGLAPDGGLYVPEAFPRLSPSVLEVGRKLDWTELTLSVLEPFLPGFPHAQLETAIRAAAARFSTPEVAPIRSLGSRHFLELFHGPTLAFKDVALSLMGGLLSMSRDLQAEDRDLLVLTATSGDTGKAALSGLAGAKGVRVLVFYPEGGVSGIQRLQMLCHDAPGQAVVGVRGNFDDAQRGVKALFADAAIGAELAASGVCLSSANSINICRLLPQIVYYVSAWRALVASGALARGDRLDVVVPSGNFGDILAAAYAKRMGLPLGRLVAASNDNRALSDFLETGRYERRRAFVKTESPSMDILVSSNLERQLFETTGRDAARCSILMSELAEKGTYEITPKEREGFSDFVGVSASGREASEEIGRVFREDGYLIDPHTAVAAAAERTLRVEGRIEGQTLILATASPFKFPAAVARAIGLDADDDELDLAARLAERCGLGFPGAIQALSGAPIRHGRVVDVKDMGLALRDFVQAGRR